ncbi:la-related protein 1C isoform X2 [Andrographis paniculata]|uniref:la-related protein 1C isoform X2 n=1 Tax=Andrographis paniculata TaxID=175694 RepID=UPI0021E860D8|nr:la-related protein 1C isoform X2 [Andrographis paniculata]
MAAASNSSTSPVQAQNSPRSRQTRRPLAARGNPPPSESLSPPPLSLSETADPEQFVTSSSTASFESSQSKEADTVTADSSYLGEDGSPVPAGADALVDNNDNSGAAKRAWNKPSNGPTAEVGAVMGAESWPALSESARASPKSSPIYSVKAPSHGPITVSQDVAVGSLSSPKKVNVGISSPHSSSNPATPTRQKSMKQRGGSSLSHNTIAANGSLSQAPTAGAVAEAPPLHTGKSGGSGGEPARDSIQRDGGSKGGSHGGNEQQQQQHRGSFRRNNSGSFSRGDNSYHHSNGGRRDQDRGKQDWGASQRNFGGRDGQASHQRGAGSRPFLRGSAPNAPFIPPLVLPFPTMVYTEMPTPVYYVPGPLPDSVRPMPMVPISPVYLPMPDPNLATKIVNQIDYYFSNENLVKDTFLRQNMDNEGWVSINLIAGFKKGDKVRRRNDWIKWIMPPTQPAHLIHEPSQDVLASKVGSISLNENAAT